MFLPVCIPGRGIASNRDGSDPGFYGWIVGAYIGGRGYELGVGVGDSSTYQLGNAAVSTSLLDIGKPGFNPRSVHSFLYLHWVPDDVETWYSDGDSLIEPVEMHHGIYSIVR